MQDLKKWFQKARLSLKLEREPLSPRMTSNRDIFQMTIAVRGKKNKREYFKIYYGDEDNDIRVIDVDPETQQLILLVREPPREFKTYKMNEKTGLYDIEVTRKTPSLTRKYLIGMDEAHLFISELPQEGAINKIKEAHKILKPEYVIKSEKDNRRIKRQGEWFFIPVSTKEQELIEKNENFIEKKVPIGRTVQVNVHTADELLNLEDKIYVNGKIRHVEHKTLKLRGWFRVLKNIEVQNRIGVINWID